MPYRILVVDDEPIHRNGLIEMLRKLRPEYEIVEAGNGNEALNIVNSNNVDIIITDIRMPVMDGLAFLEEINNLLSKVKVIMLSGYAEFNYAQRAIKLGALDYILKPVNEARVNDILEKAEKKIEEEKRAQEENKLFSTSFPVYLEHQLNKFVKGRLNKTESQEILGLFESFNTGFMLTTKIKNYSSCNFNDFNTFKNNIKYDLKIVLDSYFHSLSFFDQENENIIVTIITQKNVNKPEDSEITALLKIFVKQIKEQYSFDVVLGIGNQFSLEEESMINSYMNSILSVNYAFFFENSTVLNCKEIEKVRFSSAFSKYVEESELYDAIKRIDYIASSEIFINILERFTKEQFPSPESLKELVVFILFNSSRLCQSFIGEEEYSALVDSVRSNIYRVQSFVDLEKTAIDYLRKIVEIMSTNKVLRYEKVFIDCKKYINDHYMEDLKLDDIASKFNFNSNYFSALFKNYTNMNLSDYIFNVRMKKAKEYLKSNTHKIYEIAEKIGYKDVKYFIRVFKKTYGMSPDEFRKFMANNLL